MYIDINLKSHFIDKFMHKFATGNNAEKIQLLIDFEPPLTIVDYEGILVYYKELISIDFEYLGFVERSNEVFKVKNEFVLGMVCCVEDEKEFRRVMEEKKVLVLIHK